jgi:hypothetical protein
MRQPPGEKIAPMRTKASAAGFGMALFCWLFLAMALFPG